MYINFTVVRYFIPDRPPVWISLGDLKTLDAVETHLSIRFLLTRVARLSCAGHLCIRSSQQEMMSLFYEQFGSNIVSRKFPCIRTVSVFFSFSCTRRRFTFVLRSLEKSRHVTHTNIIYFFSLLKNTLDFP